MEIDINEYAEGAILLDGFDDCILGITEEFGGVQRILYSKEKIIQKLMEVSMTRSEAEEYYDFNILGLYVSEQNPIFLDIDMKDNK
jgi:hypothetical protein